MILGTIKIMVDLSKELLEPARVIWYGVPTLPVRNVTQFRPPSCLHGGPPSFGLDKGSSLGWGLLLIRSSDPLLWLKWPDILKRGYKSFMRFREYPWIRIVAMNLHYKTKRGGAMLTSCPFANISGVSVNDPRIYRHIYVSISAPV